MTSAPVLALVLLLIIPFFVYICIYISVASVRLLYICLCCYALSHFILYLILTVAVFVSVWSLLSFLFLISSPISVLNIPFLLVFYVHCNYYSVLLRVLIYEVFFVHSASPVIIVLRASKQGNKKKKGWLDGWLAGWLTTELTDCFLNDGLLIPIFTQARILELFALKNNVAIF